MRDAGYALVDSSLETEFKRFATESGFIPGEWQEKTTYNVVVWNHGRSTLKSEAIMAADPLALSVGERSRILAAAIMCQRKISNGATIEVAKDRKSVELKFAYLDWRDGVELEIDVIHHVEKAEGNWASRLESAISSHRAREVQMIGTLMGVDRFRRLRKLRWEGPIVGATFTVVVLLLLIGLGLCIASIFSLQPFVAWLSRYPGPMTAAIIGAEFAFGILVLWHYRNLPKGRDHWHGTKERSQRRAYRVRRDLIVGEREELTNLSVG